MLYFHLYPIYHDLVSWPQGVSWEIQSFCWVIIRSDINLEFNYYRKEDIGGKLDVWWGNYYFTSLATTARQIKKATKFLVEHFKRISTFNDFFLHFLNPSHQGLLKFLLLSSILKSLGFQLFYIKTSYTAMKRSDFQVFYPGIICHEEKKSWIIF